MYYVYVLKELEDYYIGYTDNLARRVKEHSRNNKINLIYYEAYVLESLARARERKLKYYGSAWRGLKKRLKI